MWLGVVLGSMMFSPDPVRSQATLSLRQALLTDKLIPGATTAEAKASQKTGEIVALNPKMFWLRCPTTRRRETTTGNAR